MKVTFKNWEKFQHKRTNGSGKIVENPSWFRLDNKIFFHPLWGELLPEEFQCFIFMLCQASINKNTGIFNFVSRMHSRMSGLDESVFHRTIKKLKTLQVIEMRADRGCYARVDSAVLTEQDKTEQDKTEQDKTEQDRTISSESGTACEETKIEPVVRDKPARSKEKSLGSIVWDNFSQAYEQRYGIKPVRNATTNSQCSALAARLGKDALDVVRFYLKHNGSFYLQKKHVIGICLSDAESLHAQWQQGIPTTSSDVKAFEKDDYFKSQRDRLLGKKHEG